MDDKQSDPNVALCFAGAAKSNLFILVNHNDLFLSNDGMIRGLLSLFCLSLTTLTFAKVCYFIMRDIDLKFCMQTPLMNPFQMPL